MTVAFLVLAVVLIALGAFVVDGAGGNHRTRCRLHRLFGAGIRLISRNDPAPRDEGRVPAGHSGV